MRVKLAILTSAWFIRIIMSTVHNTKLGPSGQLTKTFEVLGDFYCKYLVSISLPCQTPPPNHSKPAPAFGHSTQLQSI